MIVNPYACPNSILMKYDFFIGNMPGITPYTPPKTPRNLPLSLKYFTLVYHSFSYYFHLTAHPNKNHKTAKKQAENTSKIFTVFNQLIIRLLKDLFFCPFISD